MEEQKEPKEIDEQKAPESEYEIGNSENGEEHEDIQEESEEIEEEYDEELIPNKENFFFELNNSLLTPLNNESYSTEELIEKIIPQIKLNSKNYEEIGLYIYIHFLYRNSYEIFLNISKNISHKDI